MREIIKECKKIFNEYGTICFAIVFIVLSMIAMSWALVCGAVYAFTFILRVQFSWCTATIIWMICIVTLKIYKKQVEKEIEEERLKTELDKEVK